MTAAATFWDILLILVWTLFARRHDVSTLFTLVRSHWVFWVLHCGSSIQGPVKWSAMITLSVWNGVPYSPSVCVKVRAIFTQCLVKSHPIFTQCFVKWCAIFTKCLCEIMYYIHSMSGEITSHSHSVSVWNDMPYSLSVCVKWCAIFTQCLCEIMCYIQWPCEIICHIHSVSVWNYVPYSHSVCETTMNVWE